MPFYRRHTHKDKIGESYSMKRLLILVILWAFMSQVSAQAPHACGQITSLSVVYATVDNMGVAPRPLPGSETQFNCIAARDTDFYSRRFPNAWQALNYWFILYSQELGMSLQPLPAPTG